MILLFRIFLVCLLSCYLLSVPARAQLNIGNIVNEISRHAAEQQRRQQEIETKKRAEQAAKEEQRRRDADLRAQQKAEQERRAAQARVEAERRAAEQAEREVRQRAAEDARKHKEATARLTPTVKQLIDDAVEFLKTSPPRALELVEQISTLSSLIDEGDPAKLQAAMQGLISELRSEPGYDAFEQKRGEVQREEANRQVGELLKLAEQQRDFIKYYVTRFPTAVETKTLLPLIKQLDAAAKTGDAISLKALTSKVEASIRQAGLSDQFVKTRTLLGAAGNRDGGADLQDGLLRKTQKNGFVIEGALEDFVLMYNASPKAPHVAKNLRGDIEFEGSIATACIYHRVTDRRHTSLLQKKLAAYKIQGGGEQAECNRADVLEYDVIAMERGSFLRLKPELSLPLLSSIESDQFRHLLTVTHEERVEAAKAEDHARQQILTDIRNAARNGFGIIIADELANDLCIVAGDKGRAHKQWLYDNADRITEMRVSAVVEVRSIEDAYRATQRKECGAAYAVANDLRKLVEALDRDGTAYSPSILWSTEDDIDAMAQRLLETDKKEVLAAEERRQKADSERTQAELKRQHDSASRERRQQELRTQYNKIATSLVASLTTDVKSAFDNGADWQSTPAFQQFPRLVSTYQNLVQSRWELQTFNSEVSDYGTAEWKGRPMDAVLAKASIRLRNRIIGEYKDLCFIFARLADAEFNMFRESEVVACENNEQAVTWKRRHNFQSRWIAD